MPADFEQRFIDGDPAADALAAYKMQEQRRIMDETVITDEHYGILAKALGEGELPDRYRSLEKKWHEIFYSCC